MSLLGKMFRHALWASTIGSKRQSYLGARWVRVLLKMTPRSWKRRQALRILSWSPHYFYRNDANAHLSSKDFLESDFERNRESRRKLCRDFFEPLIDDKMTVVDQGCGPGFLSCHLAEHSKKVYAVDLSKGVLACARIVNSRENID